MNEKNLIEQTRARAMQTLLDERDAYITKLEEELRQREMNTRPAPVEPAGDAWMKRAWDLMKAATEYNREVIGIFRRCDEDCECYVCEMEQLLAEKEAP